MAKGRSEKKTPCEFFWIIDNGVTIHIWRVNNICLQGGFFYNVGMAIGVIPGFDLPGVDKDSTKMKFETVNKTTLGFFNNYLKNINDKYWNKTVSQTNENKSFTELKILKEGD